MVSDAKYKLQCKNQIKNCVLHGAKIEIRRENKIGKINALNLEILK